MKQVQLEKKYLKEVHLNDSEAVYKEMKDFKDWNKEVFVAFYLDSANKIISREIISIGILNAVLVHPREVFKSAIIHNANSIIVCHNHPSQSLTPSPEDENITARLRKAGEVIGIKLLDHIIISQDCFFSFADKGIIKNGIVN
ncbi:MAG: DNA repair protein RadC [Bacteroidetes bacterium]|nr:DNA repair protein RadC [Bacteroidota bacterium]